jgi:hypothetical protein
MNYFENFYIQLYQHKALLISEQNTCEMNHLFTVAYDMQKQYAYA